MCVYRMMSVLGLSTVSLMIVGCSGGPGDTPPIGTVSGIVLLDGKPVPNASIMFKPLSGGRVSSAVSDDQGNYTLQYRNNMPGAKVDRHRVSVWTGKEAEGFPDMEGYVPPAKETIPAKYRGTSELEVDVLDGDNTIPLDLTS